MGSPPPRSNWRTRTSPRRREPSTTVQHRREPSSSAWSRAGAASAGGRARSRAGAASAVGHAQSRAGRPRLQGAVAHLNRSRHLPRARSSCRISNQDAMLVLISGEELHISNHGPQEGGEEDGYCHGARTDREEQGRGGGGLPATAALSHRAVKRVSAQARFSENGHTECFRKSWLSGLGWLAGDRLQRHSREPNSQWVH